MNTNYNGHSRKSGVYQIRNLNNGKVYIGSAKRFQQRYSEHIKSLNKGTHHNKHLQHAFNSDGTDAFVFEVLEVVEGEQSDRLALEQVHMDAYQDAWDNCYNHMKKANVETRTSFSKDPEKTRQLISEKSKAMWANPKHKAKASKAIKAARGTPEARRQTSEITKEQWKDPDYKERVLSVFQSEEHRELKRKQMTEWHSNPENKKRMQEINKRLSQNPKTRAKQSASLKETYRKNPELFKKLKR